jgi:hypothetical protein
MAMSKSVRDREHDKFDDVDGRATVRVKVLNPVGSTDTILEQMKDANDFIEVQTWLDIASSKNRRPDTTTYSAASVSATATIEDQYTYTYAGGEYVYTGTIRTYTP